MPSCYEGSSKIRVECVSGDDGEEEKEENDELKLAPSYNSNYPASPSNVIDRPVKQINGGLGFDLHKHYIQEESSEIYS